MNRYEMVYVRGNEALNNRYEGMIMTLIEREDYSFQVAYHTREGFPSLLVHYTFGQALDEQVFDHAAQKMLVRPQLVYKKQMRLQPEFVDIFLEYRQIWVNTPTSESDYLVEILRQNHFQKTRVRNQETGEEFFAKGKLGRNGLWGVHEIGSTISGQPKILTEEEECFDLFIHLPFAGDRFSVEL